MPQIMIHDGTHPNMGKLNVFHAFYIKPGKQRLSLYDGKAFRMAAEQ